MSEYRALRERYSLLDICRTPDLATEVTLQPVRRIEVDAAILFSDLLLPLEPMGIPFDFVRGVAVHQRLGVREVVRVAAFDGVRGERERRAGKPDQRHAAASATLICRIASST